MGIITRDDMRDFDIDQAVSVAIDRLMEVLRHIRHYNESVDQPVDEMRDEDFGRVASLLNDLADVRNWTFEVTQYEDAPDSLTLPFDNVEYVVKEILEEFGVAELCEEGDAPGEFWFEASTDDDSPVGRIVFGGKLKRMTPRAEQGEAAFTKPRKVLFDDVAQFSGIDDTELLDILHDILEYWRHNRRTTRMRVYLGGDKRADGRTSTVFIPTALQAAILEALEGKALKKQALANVVSKGEGSRLYRRGGIKELIQLGKVRHSPGRGYFRPDAPPPDAEVIESSK